MLDAPTRDDYTAFDRITPMRADNTVSGGTAPIRQDANTITPLYPSRDSRTVTGRGVIFVPSSQAQNYSTTALSLPTAMNGPVSRIDPNFSPFQTLADVFLNTFTGGYQSPTPPTGIVAVSPDSGSSGTGLVLLLLAAAGFAVYWFYFRKG